VVQYLLEVLSLDLVMRNAWQLGFILAFVGIGKENFHFVRFILCSMVVIDYILGGVYGDTPSKFYHYCLLKILFQILIGVKGLTPS